MGLVEVTAPPAEPILLGEAKGHLKVTTTSDDTLIQALLDAARLNAEHDTRSTLIDTEWDWFLDFFPGGVRPLYIPRPPLQSVTTIKYRDLAGAQITLASSEYIVDVSDGRIALAADKDWPDTQARANAVEVRFVAGYGDEGSKVPATIRAGMLLRIGAWYENRSDLLVGTSIVELPRRLSANALFTSERIARFT